MALEFDRSIIGTEFDRTRFDPVTADEIREYTAACDETNTSVGEADAGQVAPPTFVVRLRGRRFMPSNLPPTWATPCWMRARTSSSACSGESLG